MSEFEAALLIGLVVVALINIANPRGLLWLAVGAVNYIVTSAYYEAGMPLHPFFTALADAITCFLIYTVCRSSGGHNWELPLFTVFQFSVLVSFVKLMGAPSDYVYALLLELVNWVALLIIAWAGTARLADVLGSDRWVAGRSYLRRAVLFTGAPTRLHFWWWASWASSRAP